MSAADEFEKRRAVLAPTDVPGRIRLARWAFERQQYDEAYDVAKEATVLDPRNQDAQEMLRRIDAQRRLNQRPPGDRQPMPPGMRGPGAAGQPGGDDAATGRPNPPAGQDKAA